MNFQNSAGFSEQNPELDLVRRNAKELLNTIKQGEKVIENVLKRESKVTQKITCMSEFESELNRINHLTVNGARRSVILGDLQRENRQIMALQDENRWLKESVDECLSTLGAVMTGHKAICETVKRQEKLPTFQDFASIAPACQFSDVDNNLRNHAIRLGDIVSPGEKRICSNLEISSQLITENRALREMLQLASYSQPSLFRVLKNAMDKIDNLESCEDDN